MQEARMEETPHGLVPSGEGWFVVNLRRARWRENARFGKGARFEGDVPFPHFGINVRVLEPGQPACQYHREDQQEAFLVLAGSCRLLIEGEERLLEAWDFVHCPPDTNHVFIGAGDGPCSILMVGHRDPDEKIVYPVEPLAQRYGAGVDVETPSPAEAYAGIPETRDCPAPPPFA